jgi:hypothetical protein
MAARKPLDRTPGTVPEVHADGENVTFRFDVAGIVEPAKLVLRCNAQGGIWASIVIEYGNPPTGNRDR